MSCSTQKWTVFIRKADENVKAMRQTSCKNHVWRKDYLNGGKKCKVCMKKKADDSIGQA